MILTKEQLNQAQRWLGSYYADEDTATARASRLPYDDDRRTCRAALVSYAKMMALLDEWAKEEEAIRIPERFIHEARRALEVGCSEAPTHD